MYDMKESTEIGKMDVQAPDSEKLVDWENPPSLADLKADLEEAQPSHVAHVDDVDGWIAALNGEQNIKVKPGRSRVVPKLIRKQAEWRYSSLSEPFLSTDELFNTAPVTFEDKDAAYQNGMLLNYQFNNKIDKTKFIDEYVRTAVDEGTVVVRVGWEYEEEQQMVEVPVMEMQPINPMQLQMMQQQGQQIPPEVMAAMQQGQMPMMEVQVDVTEEEQTVVTKNQPTLEVCNYNNVVIDPTCNGDIKKAEFIIFSFETSMSELKKDGRYKNLEYVNVNSAGATILSTPDHEVNDESHFKFNDEPRRKLIAYEYWGYWDIEGNGEVSPIVATWIGDTLVRMEENPFPDKQLPFVLVQYLPLRKGVYGEPDGALLEDNQKIIGAVTRGMIDIIGRSANGQQGIRKDALDVSNARKFERGEDYKFNSNVDPRQAFHMGTYPEIPNSAMAMLQLQNNEAESLTGVKAFAGGISGQALGNTATGIRSALDATSKRELGILRRLASGIIEIGRKVISMNQEFLSDEEVIRVTNEDFVAINRDDLGGRFDVKLNISTAEADEQKAGELSFMLQTMGNSLPFDMTKMLLVEMARLRKMPDLAKSIEQYQPQPDPMAQQRAQLELALLQAQIANETAKGQENAVDVQLKSAKAATEQAKARDMHSRADLSDLNFVEQERGVNRAHQERMKQLDQTNALQRQFLSSGKQQETPQPPMPAEPSTGPADMSNPDAGV
jgi:hypothetical protein